VVTANPGWAHRPDVPVSVPSAALRVARATRGEWLTAVASGVVCVEDLVAAAAGEATPASRPLRAIFVVELLASQPGWGLTRATAAVATVRRIAGASSRSAADSMRVAWVVDRRTGPARLDALIEVLHPTRDELPFFPFGSVPANKPSMG